ncbi:MAG: hypothetical protein K8S99_14150 [Planctomycetes bacterium]|nr:hypothetical protein [Planctomycetota bacterium]
MQTEIATALIAASGAIVLAGASYWFTKKQERDAELSREKLEHYKDFVASLSGIITGESNADGQRAFSRACNKLNLIAPQAVLHALQEFQQEIKASNTQRDTDRHDKLMSRLFYEIRKDLGVVPKDSEMSFKVGLWAAGVPSKKHSSIE